MKAKERFNPFVVFRYLSNRAKFKKASKILGLGYSKKDIELLAEQYRYISLRKDRKRKGAYIITKCHRGGAFIPFETVYVGPFISKIKRRAFRQKNALVNGVILDSASTVLEPEAFMGETCLWNVTISDEVREIPDRCFKDCNVLTNLKLGKGLERIGEEAFAGCRKLNFIGLTSCPNLKAIGACAFVKGEGNYSSIEGYAAVALPESIEEIGPNAIAIGRVVRVKVKGKRGKQLDVKGRHNSTVVGIPDSYRGEVHLPTVQTTDNASVYQAVGLAADAAKKAKEAMAEALRLEKAGRGSEAVKKYLSIISSYPGKAAEAKCQLGFMYLRGKLVPADPNKAFAYLKDAGKAGIGAAAEQVAYCYHDGIGTPSNFDEAYQWLMFADRHGASVPESRYDAWSKHRADRVVSLNDYDSRQYDEALRQAGTLLDADMAHMVATIYRNRGQYAKAVSVLRKPAQEGHQKAVALLKEVEPLVPKATPAPKKAAPKPAAAAPTRKVAPPPPTKAAPAPAKAPKAAATTSEPLTEDELDEMMMARHGHHLGPNAEMTIMRRKYRTKRRIS